MHDKNHSADSFGSESVTLKIPALARSASKETHNGHRILTATPKTHALQYLPSWFLGTIEVDYGEVAAPSPIPRAPRHFWASAGKMRRFRSLRDAHGLLPPKKPPSPHGRSARSLAALPKAPNIARRACAFRRHIHAICYMHAGPFISQIA